MIVSEKMYELGSKRSAIRELFEYGKRERRKSARKMFMISALVIRLFRHRNVSMKQSGS